MSTNHEENNIVDDDDTVPSWLDLAVSQSTIYINGEANAQDRASERGKGDGSSRRSSSADHEKLSEDSHCAMTPDGPDQISLLNDVEHPSQTFRSRSSVGSNSTSWSATKMEAASKPTLERQNEVAMSVPGAVSVPGAMSIGGDRIDESLDVYDDDHTVPPTELPSNPSLQSAVVANAQADALPQAELAPYEVDVERLVQQRLEKRLSEALQIQSQTNKPLTIGQVVSPNEESRGRCGKMPLIFAAFVCGILVIGGIVAGVLLSRPSDDQDGTDPGSPQIPTLSPSVIQTTTPTSAAAAELIAILEQVEGFATEDSINNSSSPQFAALSWITTQDPLYSSSADLSPQEILQRYAAAAIIFSLDPDGTMEDVETILQSGDPICSWNIPGFRWGFICYEDGVVGEIVFERLDLTGTVPAEVAYFPDLRRFDVSFNQLRGQIPTAIGDLGQLLRLRLNNNLLTGHVPSEVGTMRKLQHLLIYTNELSGPLPSEVGNLSSLLVFDTGFNVISGKIPEELYRLTSMNLLVLNECLHTGSISSGVSNLSSLVYLFLNDNMINGSLPTEFGVLPSFTHLEMRSNLATGALPTEFGKLSDLVFLRVAENRLTGTIPKELANLSKMTSLYFSGNLMTGLLPPKLPPSLVNLRFDDNGFYGTVPSQYGELTNLFLLTMFRTQLRGSVESRFCDGDDSNIDVLAVAYCPPDASVELGFLSCPCCNHCCDLRSCYRI